MTTRGNPFRALEEQFERMQRQMEEALQLWDTEHEVPRTGVSTIGVDLADKGDEFVLTADVPGFDSDDIEIRLFDDTLEITAERETEAEEREERYIRSERAERTMSRSVKLPERVDEEGIEATCKNGVLTIALPKAEPTSEEGTLIEIE